MYAEGRMFKINISLPIFISFCYNISRKVDLKNPETTRKFSLNFCLSERKSTKFHSDSLENFYYFFFFFIYKIGWEWFLIFSLSPSPAFLCLFHSCFNTFFKFKFQEILIFIISCCKNVILHFV